MGFLSNVSSGAIRQKNLILLYGPEGVGKSFFGANCPAPIFLGSEKGTEFLDVTRLPQPDSWSDVLGMVEEVSAESHNYQTLVLDTLDWIEPFMYEHLLEEYTKAKVIEDICGGYGKWVNRVNMEWKVLMSKLEQARTTMNIVLLAHSHVKPFHDPINNETYDRFQLKLHSQSASNLFKEYVDCLLFANYDVYTKKENKTDRKAKAYGDGERVLYTERRPAFDAKNRAGLPFEMELDAVKLFAAIEQNFPESKENLIGEIESFMEKISDQELKDKIAESVEKNKDNANQLTVIRNRVQQKLGELHG